MAHKLITKAEAIKEGLKTYRTGKLCSKGHDAPRYTNSDKCIECHKERNARRQRGKAKPGKTPYAKAVTPIFVGEPVNKDWRYYSTQIRAHWQRAVGDILITGKVLIEAKAAVDRGDWLKLVQTLPFREDTAQRLMAIARHPVLSNTEHVRYLPPSWGTLYELTKLPEPVLLARIEDHSIHPDMQRKDVAKIAASVAITKAKVTEPEPKSSSPEVIEAEAVEVTPPTPAEIEAAREAGHALMELLEKSPEPELAREIVMVIGKERAALLIVELQKLISTPRE